MCSLNDWDGPDLAPAWPPGEAGRPLPKHSAALGATVRFVTRYLLSPAHIHDEAVLAAARRRVVRRTEEHARAHGFVIGDDATWEIVDAGDAAPVELHLEVSLTERLDGVWGEIRHALREDREDRERASA